MLYILDINNSNFIIIYEYIVVILLEMFLFCEIDYMFFYIELFVKVSYVFMNVWEVYGVIFWYNSNFDFESIYVWWWYVVGVVYYLDSKKS